MRATAECLGRCRVLSSTAGPHKSSASGGHGGKVCAFLHHAEVLRVQISAIDNALRSGFLRLYSKSTSRREGIMDARRWRVIFLRRAE